MAFFGAPSVPNTTLIENGASLITQSLGANQLGSGGFDRDAIVRSGGSWIMDGSLQVSVGSNLLVDNGTLTLGAGEALSLFGDASSSGRDRLTLLNANINAGVISLGGGIISIGGRKGDAAGAAGAFNVNSVNFSGTQNVELVFNHTNTNYLFGSAINTGSFVVPGTISHLAGDTIFASTAVASTFLGHLDISGGRVRINPGFNGSAFGQNATASVRNGGTLGGSGSFSGSVAVTDGTIAPGNSPGTLTLDNLSLTAASTLLFELGSPTGVAGVDSDLINVGSPFVFADGNLTLDGTLNVVDAGGFGAGVYRLINYDGILTNNGLNIGFTPVGFATTDLTVQTATAQQVNLLVNAPITSFSFWDGANTTANNVVDGGTSSWTTTANNWTVANGSSNGVFDPSTLLIFQGTPGTVAVDNSAGAVALQTGMQFAVDGYVVTGSPITLSPGLVAARVGDGTLAGASFLATIASNLTGGGGLEKTDLGTLVLTGSNSYTSGTTVTGGTLRGNTSSLQGQISIQPAGTLEFDQATNGTFAGEVLGVGTFIKTGVGVLSVTGNSSVTGIASVAQGTLDVASGATFGSTSSSMTVDSGASITGSGMVGTLAVLGTVAPGAGTATLNVNGGVNFEPGSTYAVEVAASGASDLVVATGAVAINGGTVAVAAIDPSVSYTNGTTYTIASGSSVTGVFSGLVDDSAFLDFTLGYTPTTAFLTLLQAAVFPDVAETFNQRQAATGLAALDQTGGSDSLAVYNQILVLSGAAARDAFDAASGEVYPTLLAARQREGLELSRTLASRSHMGLRDGWGVWVGPTVRNGKVSSDGNGSVSTSDSVGAELGMDYRENGNQWGYGFSGGRQNGNLSLSARQSKADLESWHVGAYARYGSGGSDLSLTGTAATANTEAEVKRTINVGALSRSASSDTDVATTALGLEMRYGLDMDAWAFGPVASLNWSRSKLSSYAETGAGVLNVSSSGARDTWTQGAAGVFAHLGADEGYLDASIMYVPDSRDNSSVSMQLDGSPQAFTALPARGSHSALQLSVNGEYSLTKEWMLGGQLNGRKGNAENSFVGHMRVTYLF